MLRKSGLDSGALAKQLSNIEMNCGGKLSLYGGISGRNPDATLTAASCGSRFGYG
jgi:hypothetical protein